MAAIGTLIVSRRDCSVKNPEFSDLEKEAPERYVKNKERSLVTSMFLPFRKCSLPILSRPEFCRIVTS